MLSLRRPLEYLGYLGIAVAALVLLHFCFAVDAELSYRASFEPRRRNFFAALFAGPVFSAIELAEGVIDFFEQLLLAIAEFLN